MTQYTSDDDENRLAFAKFFYESNQTQPIMDWSFTVWNAALSHQAAEIERLKAKQRKIYAAFYVNMLRCYPEKSHDEIRAAVDEAIDQARKESE